MSETARDHPPDRWAWVYAAMWLVFLLFPAVEALDPGRPPTQRVLSLVGIAVFAAAYVGGFLRAAWRPTPATTAARVAGVLVLALLWAGVTWSLGAGALGMLIFVVSYAAFLGTRLTMAVTFAGVMVATAVVALRAGDDDGTWFQVPLVVLSSAAVVGLRLLEDRQEDRRDLLEELALVAERDRVARDVHDVLGHTLTVVTTKAELAERLVERDPQRATAELQEIRALSREALEQIRSTVAGLRVVRLDDELAAARVALVAAGIEAVVPDDGSVVDPRRRPVLAWVLREAVTNVVRHSEAQRCQVSLDERGLSVCDDGRGLGGSRRGLGLGGIADRARAAGATLTVGAAGEDASTSDSSGPGTSLRVAWS